MSNYPNCRCVNVEGKLEMCLGMLEHVSRIDEKKRRSKQTLKGAFGFLWSVGPNSLKRKKERKTLFNLWLGDDLSVEETCLHMSKGVCVCVSVWWRREEAVGLGKEKRKKFYIAPLMHGWELRVWKVCLMCLWANVSNSKGNAFKMYINVKWSNWIT